MNVVLYMRYSSDKQNEQSIEGQERVCRDFCEHNNYNIISCYYDRALSASKDTSKRVDFLRMIKDSEKGNFEAVVVYKLDRFSRNRYDSATYKARLKKNGVKVISATENISDNPEGIILESVLEGMAEFYSKELAQKVHRGMYESAKKGNAIGGMPLMGYKIINKKWVIDEEKAPLIKEAYSRYANGEKIIDIIDDFNNRGYRTNKGNLFNKSTFHRVFGNEKYLGIFRYEDIVRYDVIPPLIDKETFEIVKRRKETSSDPKRGVAKADFLLAGKIYCGHCEHNMSGGTGTSKTGKKYHYYECPNHKNKKTCKKRPVPKDAIENAVIEETIKLLTPEFIDMVAETAVKVNEEERSKNLILKSLRNELKDIEKSLSNLLKVLENGIMDIDTITKRMKELEVKKKDIESKIRDEEANDFVMTKEMVLFFFDKFINMDKSDSTYAKILIDTLVNSVWVYDDDENGGHKIKIAWNLTTYTNSVISVRTNETNAHHCNLMRTPYYIVGDVFYKYITI